ncbi:SDR family oxidoreductase [Psychrobacillus sp. INOP01]|uniref:SDR family oxidoreductase n=1 Tax=Psychrobacillus sp. INOP01 TaxID=2829187 RepID=UPI001BA4A68A|nr:SDR family oxidoreductase [Psychrobacillus sp. INOP01]QUG40898.1 SDR family oxidoreductase [Psychrobacillus sp. INOP01]
MSIALMTGFPGFLAKNIIKELRQQKAYSKIYVLVLPSQTGLAEKMIEEIYQDQLHTPLIEIVEGDITLPEAGIQEAFLKKLRNDVEYVWHLAAIYDLAVSKEIAWKVNVHGTDMFNKVVTQFSKLKRYVYFSTAYVAGLREGKLLETELIRPDGFKNHYEETKYEAELLVEKLKETIPVTIIRPGIVRGHSETGETIKFDGPYFFVNMISKLRKLPIIPYLGKSNSYINVVPSDFITKASIYCSFSDEAIGQTIHLTDPQPYPVEEVYRAFVKEITGKFPKWRLPLPIAKSSVGLYPVRKFLQVEKETLDYLTWNATFDTTNAESILEKGKISCPDFIQSIPSMITFYNAHKDDSAFHIPIK